MFQIQHTRFLGPGFAKYHPCSPLAFDLRVTPKKEAVILPPSCAESASEVFLARSLGECPHRHMDPEKGEDSADHVNNSDDVVTKQIPHNEAQDAIAYPNVFWTSCVSFGVALGLFLVRQRFAPWPVSTYNANNTTLGRLGHGAYAKSSTSGCVGLVSGSRVLDGPHSNF